MENYIKVTLKNKPPFISTAATKSFFEKQGAVIEIPTREEIEKAHPYEFNTEPAKTKTPDTAAHSALKSELKTEKAAHEETKKLLNAAIEGLNAEKSAHEETKKALKDAEKELKELKNK